jgi:hypothetical protein
MPNPQKNKANIFYSWATYLLMQLFFEWKCQIRQFAAKKAKKQFPGRNSEY